MTEIRVRRADAGDAGALVVLRAAMFAAMGTDPGGPDAPWRAAAADWFAGALGRPDRFAAFVVDDPGRGVVSGAAAECERHTPGPSDPDGFSAHLFNVSTLAGAQRRGYARACVAAVLGWVREETTAGTVTLSATPEGSGMYRGLGFTAKDHPAMWLSIRR